jgi:uncharacterized protein YkwD
MIRPVLLSLSVMLSLAACAPITSGQLAADGKPRPKLYQIRERDTAKIQFRVLDSVNALRQAASADPLELSAALTAAAATHARDMSVQNRPWHFGSDGSSPIDRVARAGYSGAFIGEVISETYETEMETLAAWMEEEGTRRVILNSNATEMGFAWFQEENGKIWWTLVLGKTTATPEEQMPLG